MNQTAELTDEALVAEIQRLKAEKNAIILAHYYQRGEIQDIADFIGDSLDLSRKAAATEADIILFAGVYFMAETAKILNPHKKVLIPDKEAGCSLESSCPEEGYAEFINQHPDHVKITYINCSAEVKALSDIICTSSNAEQIINSIPKDQPILFAPDKNLGNYLAQQTGREMKIWEGECIVHKGFSMDKLLALYKENPTAKIIAHPESEDHILQVASFIGSTRAMINYVKEDRNDTFIVATEAGILHQMQKDVPHKTILAAPSKEDNTCACSECGFMKLNTLEKIYQALKTESPEVILKDHLLEGAKKPIETMLSLSV